MRAVLRRRAGGGRRHHACGGSRRERGSLAVSRLENDQNNLIWSEGSAYPTFGVHPTFGCGSWAVGLSGLPERIQLQFGSSGNAKEGLDRPHGRGMRVRHRWQAPSPHTVGPLLRTFIYRPCHCLPTITALPSFDQAPHTHLQVHLGYYLEMDSFPSARRLRPRGCRHCCECTGLSVHASHPAW